MKFLQLSHSYSRGSGTGILPFTLMLAIFANLSTASAQTGNVGIGTTTPGSKLTVNGSVAATYKTVTGNYSMTAEDFYVVSNSATNSTITLPAALPVGSGNFKGRLYEIKNTHTTSNVTVAANDTEQIDEVGATGSNSIIITPGSGVLLVSNGNTTGITWEVVSYHRTTPAPLPSPSQTVYVAIPAGTYSSYSSPTTLTLPSGVYYVAPYNSGITTPAVSSSANYYGRFDAEVVSGTATSGIQAFHWNTMFNNMYTQPGFILRISSASAVLRPRLSHGNGGTFTINGSAHFNMIFQKMD